MPCRINVFSGRKRERSPREDPPKGYFVGFSHGDLSPRQAKIRQTVAENATHGILRTFVWRGERSPCENTKKSPFGGFSRCAFSPRKHDNTTWHKSATIVLMILLRLYYLNMIAVLVSVRLRVFGKSSRKQQDR